MGFFILRPHCFPAATAGAQGAAVSFFNRYAKEMGYEVEWFGPYPLARLLHELEEGNVDGSVMITRTTEREKFLYFSQHSYYPVNATLTLSISSPLSVIAGPEDLNGLRIGFVRGANISPFLKENLHRVTLDLASTDDWVAQNIRKLLAGRLDAVYDLNAATVPYEAQIMGVGDQVKTLGLPEPSNAVHVVFSQKAPRGRAILDAFNRHHQKLHLDYMDFLNAEFKAVE